MRNPYIVTTANWDDLDDDVKELISKLVRANMLNRKRRSRTLRFKYSGVIDEEERLNLLQGMANWHETDPERRQQIRQMTERRLRVVFDKLFKADENDEVNLSAQEWEKVVFNIEGDPTSYYGDHSGTIEAVSIDRLHRIKLEFYTMRLAKYNLRVIITYWGPQMFKPFDGELGSELRQLNYVDGSRMSR